MYFNISNVILQTVAIIIFPFALCFLQILNLRRTQVHQFRSCCNFNVLLVIPFWIATLVLLCLLFYYKVLLFAVFWQQQFSLWLRPGLKQLHCIKYSDDSICVSFTCLLYYRAASRAFHVHTDVRSWLLSCWLGVAATERLAYFFHSAHDAFHRAAGTRPAAGRKDKALAVWNIHFPKNPQKNPHPHKKKRSLLY